MVVGVRPWSIPHEVDTQFDALTSSNLEDMLTESQLGLSDELLDLLQNMLNYATADRLSLEQILAHPWIQGEVEQPEEAPEWRN